jgi:Protein of unknown function (DUF1573)
MNKNKWLFLVVILIGCQSTDNKNNDYKLSIDTTVFVDLNFNDTLKQIVFIKNMSLSNLKVLKIESGCGCTSTVINDSTIKSKDSLPVQISYIPSKSNDSGGVIKYITIRTNSKTMPFKNIILKGNVIK